jgi:dihydrofolate reductase
MPRLSLIAAMDENGLIGAGNGLPWYLPNDLKHFKKMTLGKPILMGRKTWETLKQPLPQRQNLVMTRDTAYHVEGAKIVRTLEGALRLAKADGFEELMVVGGAEVYALALPLADTLYLTRIHAHFTGDTWFPHVDWSQWIRESLAMHPPDEKNLYAHSFEVWQRLPTAA